MKQSLFSIVSNTPLTDSVYKMRKVPPPAYLRVRL